MTLLCRLGIHRPWGCEWRLAARVALHHCRRCPYIWQAGRSEARHRGHTRFALYHPTRQSKRAARRLLERLGARAERITRG